MNAISLWSSCILETWNVFRNRSNLQIEGCSFNCIYCQYGRTSRKTIKREAFVDPKNVEQELKKYSYASQVADVATFSGLGGPTMNKQLVRMIEVTRNTAKLPVAILTNSSLMHDKNVRNDLRKADIIVAKLDAPDHRIFQKINNPHREIDFDSMLEG